MKPLQEYKVQKALQRYFVSRNYSVLIEFAFLSRIIDLVAYEADENKLISVEVKLRDFKNLIEQVKICRYFSDESFIAIPKKSFSQKLSDSLPKDIGVITFKSNKRGTRFSVERLPAPSSKMDKALVEKSKIFILKSNKNTRRSNG